jgi:hypothetical protein
MTDTLDARPITAPTPSRVPEARIPRRARGWWGIAFALGLLACEAAVTLPATAHTTSFIRAFYSRYRWPIVVTQAGELLATWFLWRFVRALAQCVDAGGSTIAVRLCGVLLCAGSMLTAAPVLLLAAGGGSAESATRLLAAWTDYSDIIMSGLIAIFGASCAHAALPTWVRVAASALAVTSLAHGVLGTMGHNTLGNIAPTLFLVYVVAVSISMLIGVRKRPLSS